eukprot:scaffold370_cov349-Pavlova_lutheri.AAC.12
MGCPWKIRMDRRPPPPPSLSIRGVPVRTRPGIPDQKGTHPKEQPKERTEGSFPNPNTSLDGGVPTIQSLGTQHRSEREECGGWEEIHPETMKRKTSHAIEPSREGKRASHRMVGTSKSKTARIYYAPAAIELNSLGTLNNQTENT